MILDPNKSLVLFSGGQDSTTCLYSELAAGREVLLLNVAYGQRHSRELQAAKAIFAIAKDHYPKRVILWSRVEVPEVLVGASPLVNHKEEVPHHDPTGEIPEGIESTFVAGRNLFFLSIAVNHAVSHGCGRIVTGVSQEDYGGYPDCRAEFVQAFATAANRALDGFVSGSLEVSTPLIHLDKRATVHLADSLPGCMQALAFSHTCYDGQYPPNPNNHASILRARGFKAAGLPDPLIVRAKQEGLLPQDHPNYGVC